MGKDNPLLPVGLSGNNLNNEEPETSSKSQETARAPQNMQDPAKSFDPMDDAGFYTIGGKR